MCLNYLQDLYQIWQSIIDMLFTMLQMLHPGCFKLRMYELHCN